jgi:hypothetical protein
MTPVIGANDAGSHARFGVENGPRPAVNVSMFVRNGVQVMRSTHTS